MSNSEQTFVVSRAKDADFRTDGLRSFFAYRDLGIDGATGGKFLAQVIRARDAVSERGGVHHHSLDFQMIYILKGWITFEYDGQGEVRLEAGDSALQPNGIRHELIACSEDLELLEITAPADFPTVHE